MPVPVPSTAAAGPAQPGAGALAARVAAGPGLREGEDWLADLRRASLLEALLADGTAAAAAGAEHGHKLDRALNAGVTALCLAAGALFPALGYDGVLALVFGLPGVPARPGVAVPAGAAYTKARARHGQAPARAMSEAGAARGDIPAGPDGTAFGLEITQLDGTTLEMAKDPALAAAFGVPSAGTKPVLRLAGLLACGTRRWIALSATGADLLWRARNGAKSVPYRTLQVLPGGSGLVLMRESCAMRYRRRKTAGDPSLPRLPDTIARLVCFTIVTRTRSGRGKTSQVRLLTTLLDPDLYPAGELAALYARHWLIEVAFLHLKKTVRGTGRVLRGRSETLVRQETWALLLAHNMIAALAARAAATAGLSPGQVCFTAVLALARAAITAGTCCPHCGKRPASPDQPLAGLDAAILALPPGRTGRQRTSGRTRAERRKQPSEPVTYTFTIIPSHLPKTDICPGS